MNALLRKQAFFDGVVPQWVLDTEERSAQLEDVFSAYDIPVIPPVLDVGAGAGILIPFLRKDGRALSPRLQDGRLQHTEDLPRQSVALPTVVELEVSGGMLRMARATHGGEDGLHYTQADAHSLPFANASFGSVHCFSVFPHFDHPVQVLREIHRCLRARGALCILHLMGHEELNALHRDAGHAVAHDILPPVGRLAEIVAAEGYSVRHAEERSDLYLVIAQR